MNFFPQERRTQLLKDISNNLRAFVSQRLIKTVDGKRAAAIEILLGSSTVSDLIMKGDTAGLKEIMEKSETSGMQTFDSALFKLIKAGKISIEEAIKNSDSPNNLKLKIKLAKGEDDEPEPESEGGGLSLESMGNESEEEESGEGDLKPG